MTPMCPNCAEIHDYMATVKLPGDEIDATEDSGRALAEKWEVMSVPTLIFLSNDGREQARASSISEVEKITKNRSLLDV